MKILASILRIRNFLFVSLLLGSNSSFSVTAAEENHLARQILVQAVENFVTQKLDHLNDGELRVKVMPIDQRIEVPMCEAPLKISASEESLRQSNVTVRASCEGSNWYLYLIVKAMQIQPVVVLATTVSPGTVLSQHHLAVVEMDKKTIRSTTFTDVEDLIGARMKRRSRVGQPVVPSQLCFVCKGDNIQISASMQGLTIRTNGIAQQDGNLGETIAVKNSSSQKMVRAQVISSSQVTVNI